MICLPVDRSARGTLPSAHVRHRVRRRCGRLPGKSSCNDSQRILDAIDRHLADNPAQQTRNKKIIVGIRPPWYYEEPMRELRVGDFRVFYDVNEAESRVTVRGIRRKQPHQRLEDIL
jgi:mRNA-degrading endonuclease RelE of RelBE toxin-antitoxin system